MSRINKYNFDTVRSKLPICTYWLKIDILIVIYVTAQIFCKLQGCKQDSLGRWFSTASEHLYRTCLPAREWYMFKLEKMATDFDRCQLCNGDIFISFNHASWAAQVVSEDVVRTCIQVFSCHKPPAAVGWVPGFIFAVFLHQTTLLLVKKTQTTQFRWCTCTYLVNKPSFLHCMLTNKRNR